MTQLNIGRVNLTNVQGLSGSAAPNGRSVQFQGRLFGAVLADVMTVRDELQHQSFAGLIMPVTYDIDSQFDGFYWPGEASFDVGHLFDPFMFDFAISIDRLGNEGSVIFRSKLVGTVAQNDHGVTEAESAPFHAPPRGHYGYNPGATIPTFVTRTGSGGAITVFRDVSFAADPWWSITPANFYNGGAKVVVATYERAGIFAPNTPNDWELSNELVKITPNGTGGRLDVSHHDGTVFETAKVWRIQSGGADVGQWDSIRILRNTPEECSIRLTRDISTGGELVLDLTLRRGSRFVSGYLTRHASATLKVVLATAEAGATVTPSGASSAVAIDRTTNDSDGNRYVVGSARSFVNDLTNGGLSKASTTTLDFFIGSEIDGSTAVGGDTSEDLCLQYLGVLAEHVIASSR